MTAGLQRTASELTGLCSRLCTSDSVTRTSPSGYDVVKKLVGEGMQ